MNNIYKAFSVYKTIKKALFMATMGNCKAMHISQKNKVYPMGQL